MKKTLTAMLAISALTSFALADIDTSNVGVAFDIQGTASTSEFVSNPLGTTLGDIDGSGLQSDAFLRVISAKGAKVFDAYWNNGAWVAGSENKNNYALVRGESVQFVVGSSACPLYVAGVLPESGSIQKALTKSAYNFLGNASVNDKTLANITITGMKPRNGDYLMVNGVKYVYAASNWYTYEAFKAATSSAPTALDPTTVSIPAGKGFFVFCGATSTITVTLDGSL